jgi:SAM-dependent methyltransferase
MTAISMSDRRVSDIHPAWRFPCEVAGLLGSFQLEFCSIEYARSLELYRRRCEAMGLTGLDTVLDAGCGMGQWSLALSLLNRSVLGVDVDSVRLFTAAGVAKELDRSNLTFRYASLHELPAPDSSADAVFCYSVIMFADMDLALREIHRVLKPGGRFIVMVDLWRWHWGRVMEGRLHPTEFIKMGVKRLLGRKARMLFGEAYFLKQLARHGFEVHQTGTEGTVGFAATRPSADLVFIPEWDPARPRLLEVAAWCRK